MADLFAKFGIESEEEETPTGPRDLFEEFEIEEAAPKQKQSVFNTPLKGETINNAIQFLADSEKIRLGMAESAAGPLVRGAIQAPQTFALAGPKGMEIAGLSNAFADIGNMFGLNIDRPFSSPVPKATSALEGALDSVTQPETGLGKATQLPANLIAGLFPFVTSAGSGRIATRVADIASKAKRLNTLKESVGNLKLQLDELKQIKLPKIKEGAERQIRTTADKLAKSMRERFFAFNNDLGNRFNKAIDDVSRGISVSDKKAEQILRTTLSRLGLANNKFRRGAQTKGERFTLKKLQELQKSRATLKSQKKKPEFELALFDDLLKPANETFPAGSKQDRAIVTLKRVLMEELGDEVDAINAVRRSFAPEFAFKSRFIKVFDPFNRAKDFDTSKAQSFFKRALTQESPDDLRFLEEMTNKFGVSSRAGFDVPAAATKVAKASSDIQAERILNQRKEISALEADKAVKAFEGFMSRRLLPVAGFGAAGSAGLLAHHLLKKFIRRNIQGGLDDLDIGGLLEEG